TQYNRGVDAYPNWRFTKGIANTACLIGENSSQGTPACEMLREMATVYPNTSKQDTIEPALTGVKSEVERLSQVTSMSISEKLNSDIFDPDVGVTNISVVRCGTNTAIGSAALIAGLNLSLTGAISITDQSESDYCIRFSAKVKNAPTFGQNQ